MSVAIYGNLLPTHWHAKRLRHLARFVSGGTPSKENSSYWQGPIPWFSPKDFSSHFLLDSEDHISEAAVAQSTTTFVKAGTPVLVVRSGVLKHTIPIALTAVDGCINQDVKGVLLSGELSPRMFNYVVRGFQRELIDEWTKQGATVESIEQQFVDNTYFPVPPQVEQERIANFLDEQTARIDALIAEKEGLRKLLAEEQQSCIDYGLLGGVEANTLFPFTPATRTIAGVVWTRCMLKQRWTVTDCKHLTVEFVDEGVPLASIREVSSNVLDLSGAKCASATDFECLIEGGRRPRKGDLIYARNASVGAVAYVDVDQPFAMGQDVCLMTSQFEDQMFLRMQLLTSPLKAQLESLLQGATIRRINVEQLRSFALFVPPPETQRHVVAKVTEQLRVRETLQLHCAEHIDRLREYRSSLISAAVTGQLDINTFEAAAHGDLACSTT